MSTGVSFWIYHVYRMFQICGWITSYEDYNRENKIECKNTYSFKYLRTCECKGFVITGFDVTSNGFVYISAFVIPTHICMYIWRFGLFATYQLHNYLFVTMQIIYYAHVQWYYNVNNLIRIHLKVPAIFVLYTLIFIS